MPARVSGSQLHQLCQELSGHRNLIISSNRGPIEYRVDEQGNLRGRRGSGGVVTALSAISQFVDLTWVASAMGEGDRRAAEQAQGERFRAPVPGSNFYLRFVVSPGSTYHKFYSIFCNPLLWFLQHNMWNASHTPNIDARVYDAWETGYKSVNRVIAESVIADASKGELPSLVMLHDYHLYLSAGYVREQVPDAIIQHFTHIPWPATYTWQLLPRVMVQEICEGLCACDIVGLQTNKDVRNFLNTCEAYIEGAEVDYRDCTIVIGNHQVRVRHYPISIDVPNLKKLTTSSWCKSYEEKLRPLFDRKTIVRVDRMEPSKNIVRGFRAFDLLLERYPELQGQVNFVALLVPSRTRIKQYRRYNEEVNDIVDLINTKYGKDDWQPIKTFYENNYVQAIAALRSYDVLLVNPVIDGMNLVAKEGPTVNTCDGVLVLSESAGACQQLKENVLSVTPTDIEGTMEALYRALTMPEDERKQQADALKSSIEEEDITLWFYQQLSDINAIALEQLQRAI
jgi:trehalose 6-phosphate synthase